SEKKEHHQDSACALAAHRHVPRPHPVAPARRALATATVRHYRDSSWSPQEIQRKPLHRGVRLPEACRDQDGQTAVQETGQSTPDKRPLRLSYGSAESLSPLHPPSARQETAASPQPEPPPN